MFLRQKHYVSKVLKKFKVASSSAVRTPTDSKADLAANDEPTTLHKHPEYGSAIEI